MKQTIEYTALYIDINQKRKDQVSIVKIEILNKNQGSTIVVLPIEDKEDEKMGIKFWPF